MSLQISESIFVKVAIFSPLRKLFDYQCPPDLLPPIIGARVLVPFGKKERIGICVEISNHTFIPLDKIKPLSSILDKETLFSPCMFQLINWASHYYHASLGEIFELALPTRLRKGKNLYPKFKKKPTLAFEFIPPPILNEPQINAINHITAAMDNFKVFVLDGITGSGKTEVYLQVIKDCLDQKKQALILVPEIGLTPQIIERFKSRFDVPIVLMHSKLTENERFKSWNEAAKGNASIIIGTRSASFIPLKNPGIFIIDEEHDLSFKQQSGVRYSARDLLIMRAHFEKCPIVLGSATPSLETIANIENQKYIRLLLPNRTGLYQLPIIKILDIRHKKLTEGLSSQLIATIKEHLHNQSQVLLFLNRRGFSPVLMCYECKWIAVCDHCDARLTLHMGINRLRCHHCEAKKTIPNTCPHCQGTQLNPIGFGTERLEAALEMLFPKVPITRIDKDTTQTITAMQQKIDSIHLNQAQILLGTQMLAKGHHFPLVTLVAILDIDSALYGLDFRNIEHLGQLITQVAGRAGRGLKEGQVLLQTSHPEHPLLNLLLHDGYAKFSKTLLMERKEIGLPPYSYQALFRSETKQLNKALSFLDLIKKHLQKIKIHQIKILGPVISPMARRSSLYRAQLLLQSSKRSHLQQVLKYIIQVIEEDDAFKKNKGRWSLDVDPLEMF
ncbi:MAG: priA [Francisellaceae bacterium]|nr:priA [Francisellaceae bacterium]